MHGRGIFIPQPLRLPDQAFLTRGVTAATGHHARRHMRCAYPRCFHEASARCATCRHVYCTEHCSDWVLRPGDRLQECDLCRQHLTLEAARSEKRHGTIADIGAIIVFLLIVGVGTAIDVSTRGSGLVVLWIFAVAFFALVTCLYR